MEHFLYLSSDASKDLYRDNNTASFRVKLPSKIILDNPAKWSVALLDVDLPKTDESYKCQYITFQSSLCSPTVHNEKLQPIMERFYYTEIRAGRPIRIDRPRYVPVNMSSIDVIDVDIISDTGAHPSFKPGQANCTLHLRQKTNNQII